MEKTKSTIPRLSFYDRTGIKNYLEEMAQNGWLLTEIKSTFWEFRGIEPKKIHFEVTYFPKNTFLDTNPSEELLIFREFCERAGWILAGSNAQMQIFYNENEDPTPIETDAEEELRRINSTALKSWLPIKILEIFLFGRLCVSNIELVRAWPLRMLSVPSYMMLIPVLAVVLTERALDIAGYLIWYTKAKKSAKDDGSFTPTASLVKLKKFIPYLCVATMIISLMGSSDNVWITAAGTIAITFVVLAMISGSTEILRSLKLSRWLNGIGYVGIYAIGFVILLYLTFITLFMGGKSTDVVYEYEGMGYGIYTDELPLYIEDMVDIEYDGYSCMLTESESVLATHYEIIQEPKVFDTHMPKLQYTVTKIKFSPLLDFAAEMTMNNNETQTLKYVQTDATPWNAISAYRLYEKDTPLNEYFICWDEHIVEITTSWEMTSEQMNVAAAILTEVE